MLYPYSSSFSEKAAANIFQFFNFACDERLRTQNHEQESFALHRPDILFRPSAGDDDAAPGGKMAVAPSVFRHNACIVAVCGVFHNPQGGHSADFRKEKILGGGPDFPCHDSIDIFPIEIRSESPRGQYFPVSSSEAAGRRFFPGGASSRAPRPALPVRLRPPRGTCRRGPNGGYRSAARRAQARSPDCL